MSIPDPNIMTLVNSVYEKCDAVLGSGEFTKAHILHVIPTLVISCYELYENCTESNIIQVLTIVLTLQIKKYIPDQTEQNVLIELLPSILGMAMMKLMQIETAVKSSKCKFLCCK